MMLDASPELISIEHFRQFFEHNMDCMFVLDHQGKVLEANRSACEASQRKREEVLGMDLHELVPAELRQGALVAIKELRKVQSFAGEFPIQNREGGFTPFEWRARCNIVNGFAVWTGRDITDRKRMEGRLLAEVNQKDTLLKETHHRIKNNFQILISLLNLQATRETVTVADIVHEYIGRVRTMALIHDDLYQGENSPAEINLSSYLEELARKLWSTYRDQKDQICLSFDCKPVSIGLDHAVPCGLIANEIISNSLKHAFPDGIEGEIRVRLRQENSTVIMDLSDNGIGLGESVSIENCKTLGLRLIEILVTQLHGKLVVRNNPGTHFHIELPL